MAVKDLINQISRSKIVSKAKELLDTDRQTPGFQFNVKQGLQNFANTPVPQSWQQPVQRLQQFSQAAEQSPFGIPLRTAKNIGGQSAADLTSSYQAFQQGKPLTGLYKGAKAILPMALAPANAPFTAASMALSSGMAALTKQDQAKALSSAFQTAPITGQFIKITNPLISSQLSKFQAPKILQNRVAPAVANIAQGIGIDVATGQKTTPLSVGIDALTGVSGQQGQFGDIATAKGFDFGRNTKSKWTSQDVNELDAVTDFIRGNKKLSGDQLKEADRVVTSLAQGYLPISKIEKIASDYGRNSRGMLKALTDEMQSSLRSQEGMGAIRMGFADQKNGKLIFHGTSPDIVKKIENEGFDVTKSADGSIWFTDKKLDITDKSRGVAASSEGGIVERVLPKNLKLADESLTDKYGVDELLSQGYDGVKYSPSKGQGTWYQIFNPEKLTTKSTGGMAQLQSQIPGIGFAQNRIKTNLTKEYKTRGLTQSVQEAPNILKSVKTKVDTSYLPKTTQELMGEAQALLQEGAKLDIKNVKNIDQKIAATIQQAISLQKTNPEAAANLFNNLSVQGTELGRGVNAFSMLKQMSPESIALSAAGQIKKFNATHNTKIPELTGDQVKMIADQVQAIDLLKGREKNIALNELQNTISSFIPSSLADKAIAVWKAGLLTSLRTHERNFVGNAIHQTFEIAKDIPATATDILLSGKTGKRTLTPTLQGLGSFGSKDTRQQMADIVSKGYDPTQTINKFDYKQITWGKNPVEQTLKKYTDLVFRTLGASDKPFYNAAMARSLYDQAGAEAINAGKRGDANLIESLVKNPTEQMLKNAISDANVATFKTKNAASEVSNALKRVLGKNELTKIAGEITIPFTGVPSSILGQTIAYSPIGLIKGIFNAGQVNAQSLPEMQRLAAQEVGRGVMGTGIYALGAYLMSKGLISGQPKDATEAKQWELENKPRNSILINGKWRSLNSIGPESVVFLAGSKLNEELNKPEGSMGTYAGNLGKDFLDQSFVTGLSAPVNAITDPARYGKAYAGQLISSPVPNIIKDTARAFDPTARETNTAMDYLRSSIPGVRTQMIEKRDVMGNVIKQEPTGIGAYVDLFNSKTPVRNQIVDELSRLNEVGMNATPSKLATSQTIKGNKVTLTPQELNSLEAQTGIEVNKALDSLINSNAYQKLDDEAKKNSIDTLITKVRKQVRSSANVNAMPNMGYVQSSDSPTGFNRIGLYGKSLVSDPAQTIQAVLNGNPIRKVEGGAVILERKNALGILDNEDTSTQVDHKIALALGGTNDKSNLQILTTKENQIKGQVETYLYNEMKAGRISKAEAQRRDLNWKDEVQNLPKSVQTKLVSDLSSDSAETYKIVNPETGSVTDIDISSPIIAPTLTGYKELDTKLKSSYTSAVSTRISNITKLYKDGQITAEKANQLISELKATKAKVSGTKTGRAKKAKKIAPLQLKVSNATAKKISYPKIKSISGLQAGKYKLKQPKLQTEDIKIKIRQ